MRTLMPVWDSSGESRLKFCAEALNHVRKIPRKQKQGSVTITVSSTIVSSTDRATWTIDGYDLSRCGSTSIQDAQRIARIEGEAMSGIPYERRRRCHEERSGSDRHDKDNRQARHN